MDRETLIIFLRFVPVLYWPVLLAEWVRVWLWAYELGQRDPDAFFFLQATERGKILIVWVSPPPTPAPSAEPLHPALKPFCVPHAHALDIAPTFAAFAGGVLLVRVQSFAESGWVSPAFALPDTS